MQWRKDSNGCHESEFNLADIIVKAGAKYCNLQITVTDIGQKDPDKSMVYLDGKLTYVISYKTSTVHNGYNGRHCIYLDKVTDTWIGLNSWGNHESRPSIPFKESEVSIH